MVLRDMSGGVPKADALDSPVINDVPSLLSRGRHHFPFVLQSLALYEPDHVLDELVRLLERQHVAALVDRFEAGIG